MRSFENTTIKFKRLFSIFFSAFIVFLVVIFIAIVADRKLSIGIAIILIIIPIAIRYLVYILARI